MLKAYAAAAVASAASASHLAPLLGAVAGLALGPALMFLALERRARLRRPS